MTMTAILAVTGAVALAALTALAAAPARRIAVPAAAWRRSAAGRPVRTGP